MSFFDPLSMTSFFVPAPLALPKRADSLGNYFVCFWAARGGPERHPGSPKAFGPHRVAAGSPEGGTERAACGCGAQESRWAAHICSVWPTGGARRGCRATGPVGHEAPSGRHAYTALSTILGRRTAVVGSWLVSSGSGRLVRTEAGSRSATRHSRPAARGARRSRCQRRGSRRPDAPW